MEWRIDMRHSRILLVDDEPEFLFTLEIFLTRKGFEVIAATDGETALRIFPSKKIDLAILDIRMPGIGGIGVSRRLREIYPRMPIIFLSAHEEEDDFVKDLIGEGDEYITKPVDSNDLLAQIEAALKENNPHS